jgi:hypothetical protein
MKLSEFLMILVMLAGLAAFAHTPAGEGGGEGSSGEEAPGAREVQEEGTYGNSPAEFVPYADSDEPHRRFFMTPLVFRGPGRDKPEPERLGAVRVGLIAPLEGIGDDQPGPDMQRGVVLARPSLRPDQREMLREARSRPGRSGTIHFDQRRNRTGDLPVGVIRGKNPGSTHPRER